MSEFGWTRAATSGGFSLSWVFTGLLSIAVGRLNDRWGPRLIMTTAGVVVGLGYLLCAILGVTNLVAILFLKPLRTLQKGA